MWQGATEVGNEFCRTVRPGLKQASKQASPGAGWVAAIVIDRPGNHSSAELPAAGVITGGSAQGKEGIERHPLGWHGAAHAGDAVAVGIS